MTMEWSWERERVHDFIEAHYGIISQELVKAQNLGTDDVLIVLQLNLEEATFQVAPFIRTQVWDDVRKAYPFPEEVQQRLSEPAGEGAAWLAIVASTGCATLRLMVHSLVNAPGGSA